ncbi:hypothetical protein H2248_008714 [Termitomyces sp. 'cryptogamus']|nr:hypothetical protein H2248_008714 [Termitomyces sp. 'cryptogamus']
MSLLRSSLNNNDHLCRQVVFLSCHGLTYKLVRKQESKVMLEGIYPCSSRHAFFDLAMSNDLNEPHSFGINYCIPSLKLVGNISYLQHPRPTELVTCIAIADTKITTISSINSLSTLILRLVSPFSVVSLR